MSMLEMEEAKTYVGGSLEEVLPQIRLELGPDALIVRQREGIVGGIGGFFGKKVVEVQAQRGASAPIPAPAPAAKAVVPPRAVIDAYDSGDDPEPEPEVDGGLMETLLAQASPFAEQLFERLEEPLPAAAAPKPQPKPKAKAKPRAQAAPAGDLAGVRRELLAATVPVRMADAIVADVERTMLPFLPGGSPRDLARAALAERIKVARPGATKKRTIAVVGLADSGRAAATADLCAGFLRGGRAVAAVSLEPARDALELAELTAEDDIPFFIADVPEQAAQMRDVIGDAEILVADVPLVPEAIDGRRLAQTLMLLGALAPDETHLVLPATMQPAHAQTLVESLATHKLPTRLIVAAADDAGASGVPVGLSLTHKIPVSFTSGASLMPAFADSLAELVLQ
jgi:flagellar biosynthesis GTPase FlhF